MKEPNFFLNQPVNYPKLQFSRYGTLIITLMLFASVSCGVTDDDNDANRSDIEQAQLLFEELMQDSANITIQFPDEDPGIPIYSRVGPILNQFFIAEDRLVIPFYRNPDCIRDDFNFLNYYDPPAAFGCDLTVEGKFVIEQDAEQGQFPIMVHTNGVQVPIWIVEWSEFQALMENESVTLPEIEALNPVKGVAQQFEEYLSPRIDEHEVIIEASGIVTETGRDFSFSLTHRADQIESIVLVIE